MTRLTLYDDQAPSTVVEQTDDRATITARLAGVGIGLERWDAAAALADDASDAAILAAYADPIARLSAARGYRSADVIRLQPDHPERDAMRARFLAEHVHDEDEVRFFVEGSGMFYIHAGGQVHALLCTAGDLIALPMGTRHWFDMGEHPRFTAIRLFTRPDGWVARFTGDPIADAVPLYAGAG
jgi:1,2-dihydroxy-3-keto-5-methylthiopentene dioxygenase